MATTQRVEQERTVVQRAAQIFGWILVALGVLGFFASGVSMEDDPLLAPRLLGLFPVSVLLNVVHLLLGVWGIGSERFFAASKLYAIGAGIVLVLLAVIGLGSPSLFGTMPVGGENVWLHLILGIALIAIGSLARRRPAVVERDIADEDVSTLP